MKAHFTPVAARSFKIGPTARTKTKNAGQNPFTRLNILTLAGIMMIAAAVLAVPSYSVHSSASPKAGSDGNSSSTILSRWSPTSRLTALLPPVSDPLETFAADCMTPQTTFVLGETVCAKATGLIGYRFAWVDSAGFIRQRVAITTDPQTDIFILPLDATTVVNDTTVDNRGEWRVNAITSRGSLKSSAFFTVTDPQHKAVDLSITKTMVGDSPTENGTVLFAVSVVNNGPNDAVNAHFVDNTFSNATFNSVTQTGGPAFVCTGSGSADCTLAVFPKGAEAKFILNFTAGLAGGGVQNTATISSATTELNALDNSFTTALVKVGSAVAPPSCTLDCPDNINATANTVNNGQSGANVSFAATTASDSCGTVTTSPASGSFFPVGTTAVTSTSTDGNGNVVGSCSFTVTVADNANAPTITCPANKDVNAANGSCSANVDPGSPTATGTGVSVSGERSDGEPLNAPYPSGATTIVWTATDDQDLTASCSQTITVHTDDTIPPTITAPNHLTLSTGADAQSCGLIVGETELGTAVAIDNCSSVHISRTGVPAGNFFPIGTTTITYTATDGAGNTATATQTVTIIDNSAPTITATAPNPNPPPATVDVPIQDVTVHTGPNSTSCDAVVSDTDLGNVQARDNCAVTLSRSPSGNTFPVGTTTITWSATDASGNTGTAMQNVTVIDDTPPTITAPADVTAGTGPGRTSCDAEVNLGTPLANDNCAFTVTHSPVAPYPVGTTTVIWTVTDASGNTANATQNVTVTDTTPPVFTTTAADSSASGDASCQAPVPNYVSSTTASDNCSSATLTQSPAAGTPVGIGPHTVTVTATDSAGNSSTDTVVFTVNDNTLPTITAPADVTAYTGAGAASCDTVVTNATLGTASATDNCGSVTVTRSPAGNTFPVGTTNVVWTATDAAGNVSTATQHVTVNDNTAPTITAPANKTLYTGPGATSCGVTVSDLNATLGTATAADNCPGVTWARGGGNVFPLGPTTVTYTATDAHGNTASATQTVTVVDNTPPVVTAPANITVQLPLNSTATSMAVNYPNPATATDNCAGPITISYNPLSGSTFSVGTTTVTVTATDAHNNSASATFTVTVLYNFTGFFSPVSNPPTLNAVNAGRAIPVKFSLSGYKGLNIFAPDNPYSVSFNCATNDPGVDIVETTDAGGSSLSFGGDQYIYVWKTESSWAGTCRQLVMTLNDGSVYVANFKFK